MEKVKQLYYEVKRLTRDQQYELIELVLKDLRVAAQKKTVEYPIKYAHWIINCDGYYLQCSNCLEENSSKEDICPHCGAIMEEEE